MPEYYYHGSPIELSELHEARPGEGIYLTPSKALAGMFGAMRRVKDKNKDYGTMWEYDLYDDYDKTGNDTPRAFNAYSNLRGMPKSEGEAEVYIHKILLRNRLLKKLQQIRNSPVSHKVLFKGKSLPVESVEKVTIPFTAQYGQHVEDMFGPAIRLDELRNKSNVKSGSKKLFSEINDIMDGYEWEAINPVNGKKIFSPGKSFFTTSKPVSYSYSGGETPFKGNCVEQSLFVRDRFPEAKFLFSRDAKPGVNNIHVTPLLQDENGYYRHVRLNPVKDKKGVSQYLSGGRFRNLKNFLKGTAHKWGDRDIDYYVLDDIPSEGDALSLLAYANAHADPLRIRGGKSLEKLRFKKNFQKIVDLYKQKFGIDLSHVKYYEDPYVKDIYGNFTSEFSPEESGGDWHADHSVRINPEMEKVIKHWKLDTKLRPFVNWMIAHELAHDVEKNPDYQDLVKQMITEAKEKEFTTPYLENVKRKYRNMETFCEYMAHKLNQKKEASLNPAVKRLVEEIRKIDEYQAPERTQTLKDILKSKGTNCWGISRLALNRLRKAGLDPETVFIYEDETPMLPTHQFTTFRDGDKYRVHDYWFNDREQIGDAFDTREAAIDARVKKWRDEENHPNPVPVYVGTNLPPVGYRPEEYMGAIMLNNKLLKTYPRLTKESSKRVQQLIETARQVKTARALRKLGFNAGAANPRPPVPQIPDTENDYHKDGFYVMSAPFEKWPKSANQFANHSTLFATLSKESYDKLKETNPEAAASWRVYDPRIADPKSQDSPYYYRVEAYTADNDMGEEGYWPIANYLFDKRKLPESKRTWYDFGSQMLNDPINTLTRSSQVLETMRHPLQVKMYNPKTGDYYTRVVANGHLQRPGTVIPLKMRKHDMGNGEFYSRALDNFRKRRPQEPDSNTTCHVVTSNWLANNPFLMPGVFSLGGAQGGYAESIGRPSYINVPKWIELGFARFHPTKVKQWDVDEPFADGPNETWIGPAPK